VSIPLPHGWIKVTLGEITEPRREIVVARSNGGRYLGLENVEARTTKVLGSGDGATIKGTVVKFQAGDTLYARLRPYLNKVCTPDFDGVASGEFIVFPAVDWLAPKFLTYFLNQPDVVAFANAHSTGTHRPRIKWDDLSTYPVLLPPLAEQHRIVATIEALFSRIDAGVEALQRARRNLQRMRAAVLQAAVTGRLVPQDPSDEPVTRLLAEANLVTGLYPAPSGWLWTRLDALAEVQGGIQKQPKRRPRENKLPFLRVANVLRNELDLSEVHMIELFDGELGRYRLRPGDLLVVEGNGSPDQIGRSALWQGEIDPCVHQNHLIRVRPGPALNPNYLNLFWNAPSTAAAVRAVASSTSGLYTLSTAKVRAVPVAVPPLSEQERIVLEVNRQLSLIDAAQRVIDEASGRARNLRATIHRRAFSGGLVPQDLSDEPAGVLLDRIKAVRAVPVSAAGPGRRAR
jgi:type I restriction enzyme S subunit